MGRSAVVLVDAMNMVWRNFHAYRELQNSGGAPTGAIHGCMSELCQIVAKLQPNKIIFCWESRNCWRRAYQEYKAARASSIDEDTLASMKAQRRALKYLFGAQILGHYNAVCPGLEADDVISLLVHAHNGLDMPVYIVSGDQDLYQCLTVPNAVVVQPSHKWLRLRASDIVNRHDVTPKLWPHYLAAGKDSSDGYKPFRGIGPATAKKWLVAGLVANKPFEQQTEEVKSLAAKYKESWDRLNTAYTLAKLPIRPQSVPPEFAQDAQELLAKILRSKRQPHKDAWSRLTQFCIKFDLSIMFARRSILL